MAAFRSLVTTFTDFLVVAIHTILYERAIYPQTSFLTARKYNFPVRQSRHPKVCEWINDAVAAIECELLKGSVDTVAVVVYTSDNVPLERFVFDTSRFPQVPPLEIDTTLERAKSNGDTATVLPLVDIEEQFRATMSKFTGCGAVLEPLPKACTFTVAIELKADSEAPIEHPQPWVPVQPSDAAQHVKAAARNASVPMRSVAAGEMIFESWIERTTRS